MIFFVLCGFIIHIVLHALMEKKMRREHIEVMVNIASVAQNNMTIATVTKCDSRQYVTDCFVMPFVTVFEYKL